METLATFEDNWRLLQSLFPKDWQSKAFETGALTRTPRSFNSVEDIMRTLLIHVANGYSLRETSAWAKKSDLAQVSDVALMKRLRCSEMWFKQLCCDLLAECGASLKIESNNINMRLVDATIVKEPGKTGSQWRIHYSLCLPDLSCDFFKLTSNKGKGVAESYLQFPVSRGDCIIGDRAYSTNKGVHHVDSHGGYSLVRVNTGALVLHYKKRSFNLMQVAKLKRAGTTGEWKVHVYNEDSDKVIEGRICAIRKSDSEIERSIKKLKEDARSRKVTPKPETIEYAKYIIVFTTLPKDLFSAQEVLELYRVRWQVELAFKRLKSIAGLGHLPKNDDKSSRSWLYGKLFVGLMTEKIIRHAGALSPWGFEPRKTEKEG